MIDSSGGGSLDELPEKSDPNRGEGGVEEISLKFPKEELGVTVGVCSGVMEGVV